MFIFYFIIILFSTTLGSLFGMGGGIIIKPVLDAIGLHSLPAINFYSSSAVFVMSTISVLDQVRGGFKVKIKPAVAISVGSIAGGVLGEQIFGVLMNFFNNESYVQLIQIILTIVTLIMALIYLRFEVKSYNMSNVIIVFLVGLILGVLATLLGIGGGPINVVALMFFFSVSLKDATVYSLMTKFFSQFAKLVTVSLNEGFFTYQLSYLWAIIPAAILGGYLGSLVNQKLPSQKINFYYRIVIVIIILLNVINGFQLFI